MAHRKLTTVLSDEIHLIRTKYNLIFEPLELFKFQFWPKIHILPAPSASESTPVIPRKSPELSFFRPPRPLANRNFCCFWPGILWCWPRKPAPLSRLNSCWWGLLRLSSPMRCFLTSKIRLHFVRIRLISSERTVVSCECAIENTVKYKNLKNIASLKK